MTNFNYLWQMVATVTMNSSMILALILFATLVTGNGNTDVLPKATRDINSFPACITDSDCTGLGGEVADFKCFQSMCFPWANKDLQGGQVGGTTRHYYCQSIRRNTCLMQKQFQSR